MRHRMPTSRATSGSTPTTTWRSWSTISGFLPKTRFPCGLELRNFVPQGHKVALADIPEGAAIRRYNEVIGTAAKPILAGEWVDEARIRMPTPPELDKLELATSVPEPQPPLEGYTFEGFRNRGRLGRHEERAGDQHERAVRRRHAASLRSSASRPSCCRNIPMSTTSSG